MTPIFDDSIPISIQPGFPLNSSAVVMRMALFAVFGAAAALGSPTTSTAGPFGSLEPLGFFETSPTSPAISAGSETLSTAAGPQKAGPSPGPAAGPHTVLLAVELAVCPEDVYTDDQFAYRVYANLPIGLFGIFANLLNVIVFCDVEMRILLVNHFLLALSISDLVLLLCNFFFLVLPVIVVDTNSFFWNDVFPVIVRYSYPLALTAQTSGVYLTVLVSVHRFLGVCYPFRAKRWVTKKPVQYAIAAAVLFSVLSNIPTWLELSVMACFSQKFNRISRQIALAPFHDMTYILVKKTVVYTFVMFFVPFLTLIVVNWRIILALRESSNLRTMHTYSTKATDYQHHQQQQQQQQLDNSALKQFHLLKNTRYSEIFHTFSKMSNTGMFRPSSDMFKTKFTNSTRDRSVTLMLLAIVALFLLCNGLAFCNSIVESIMLVRGAAAGPPPPPLAQTDDAPPDGQAADEEAGMQAVAKMFECSVEISNVLITLNSATSALVYLIFSSKYRLVLKSILGFRKRKKINRVAVTTAMAAQRAVELSLIPEEADNRQRQHEGQLKWHSQTAVGQSGSPLLEPSAASGRHPARSSPVKRLPMAASLTTISNNIYRRPPGGGSTGGLSHSNSHLRLMDDEEISIELNESKDPNGLR